MIPISPARKRKILQWLPSCLGGQSYPVIETDDIVPNLEAPAITFYFSSAGTPSLYSWAPLRRVPNQDGTVDDVWGEYHRATMNVVLRAYSKAELETMWYEFVKQCLQTRRNMVIALDGVRFLEILNSILLPPERLDDGRTLYWAQVDLLFEYEVSGIPDEDYIKRVYTHLQSQTPLDDGELHDSRPLELVREVLDGELTVILKAHIAAP
jgi:hypothetical protein